uniref:Uncharacterized protein n=1 Tax=Oryza brachyantha TaxID=4533 RepID=J3MM96_ORYBR
MVLWMDAIDSLLKKQGEQLDQVNFKVDLDEFGGQSAVGAGGAVKGEQNGTLVIGDGNMATLIAARRDEQRPLHILFLPFLVPGHLIAMGDMTVLVAARGVRGTVLTTPSTPLSSARHGSTGG